MASSELPEDTQIDSKITKQRITFCRAKSFKLSAAIVKLLLMIFELPLIFQNYAEFGSAIVKLLFVASWLHLRVKKSQMLTVGDRQTLATRLQPESNQKTCMNNTGELSLFCFCLLPLCHVVSRAVQHR